MSDVFIIHSIDPVTNKTMEHSEMGYPEFLSRIILDGDNLIKPEIKERLGFDIHDQIWRLDCDGDLLILSLIHI